MCGFWKTTISTCRVVEGNLVKRQFLELFFFGKCLQIRLSCFSCHTLYKSKNTTLNLCESLDPIQASELDLEYASIDPELYPKARKDLTVVDRFVRKNVSFFFLSFIHKVFSASFWFIQNNSVAVADPFRWMEDSESAETIEYVKELNKLSKAFFNLSHAREAIHEE